jgi:hypothetical protein
MNSIEFPSFYHLFVLEKCRLENKKGLGRSKNVVKRREGMKSGLL